MRISINQEAAKFSVIIFVRCQLEEIYFVFIVCIQWRASVAQRQSVGLGIERSRVRNSPVPPVFTLSKEINRYCYVAQLAGSAHWAEP